VALNTVVAVLIAISDASTPMTDSMTGAVAEALGPGVSLALRSSSSPSDAEALELERRLQADAIARVSWNGSDRTVAVLRVHRAKTARWIERRVNFLAADDLGERGRTLGFAVAALLLPEPEGQDVAAPASAPRAPRAGPPPAAPSPAVVAIPAHADGRGMDRPRGAVSIDLSAIGATGIAGPANGLGGAFHAEVRLSPAVFLRGGVFLRTGSVPDLKGGDTVGAAGAGLAFRPFLATPRAHPFGLGVTLEGVAIHHDLFHRSLNGEDLRQGRLLPGVTGGVEGTWAFSRAFDACLGVGGEVAFGTTDVSVAGRRVATIPAVRLMGQGGVRLHF
jgi:hypothetical protein